MERLMALWEIAGTPLRWLRDPRNGHIATRLWALAVVALVLLRFGPRLYWPPDGFDESVYIRTLAPLTWADTGRWCTNPHPGFSYFRPLGFLSLMVDRMVWGRPKLRVLADGRPDLVDLERQARDPAVAVPFRLTNLLIYIAGCLAFAALMGHMGRSRALGAIAGAVYAISPRNDMTVLYYPERFILLVSVSGFLAAYCYLRRFSQEAASRRDGVLSVALFAVALTSKEHALVLPVILVVWTLLLAPKDRWLRGVWPLLGMAAVTLVYLAVRYHVRGYFLREDMANMVNIPRFWTLPREFIFGPAVMTVRTFLNTTSSVWTLLTPNFWGALFSLVVFWGSAYILLRRQWRLLLCWCLWLPVLYAPIAHAYAFDLFPYKLYLPSAGMIALTALSIWQWLQVAAGWGWWQRGALAVALALVVRGWLK